MFFQPRLSAVPAAPVVALVLASARAVIVIVMDVLQGVFHMSNRIH